MHAKLPATMEDLMRVPGKAELVNGEIVHMPPTQAGPGYAADEIYASLRDHAKRTGVGLAIGDNKAFLVNLPHRRSVSPDAAYYTGPIDDMDFFPTAPVFAVEVRSKGDYGPAAEKMMAAKRADYFAAGALVVWDIDLLSEDVVRKYAAASPDRPTIFRKGQEADAEPAVAGWTMKVDELYRVGE